MNLKKSLILSLCGSLALATVEAADTSSTKKSSVSQESTLTLTGAIKDAGGATYESVEKINTKVRPLIKDLVLSDYFRYYKVDLSDDLCPFVEGDQGICGNRACAIEPIEDESELPEFWKSQYLGKLAKDSYSNDPKWQRHGDQLLSPLATKGTSAKPDLFDRSLEVIPESVDDDANYCYPEDESLLGPGVYVSLPDNPERFTGYGGSHAHKVWRAVYQENCFGYFGEEGQQGRDASSPPSAASSSSSPRPGSDAASQLEQVLMRGSKYEMQEVGGEAGRHAMNDMSNICVEQRLFYRLLSGMQSSISSHLCYEYLNKTSGEWEPNEQCFVSRVGNYPERMSNLYFNYALVGRAVSKLRNYVDELSFYSEDSEGDACIRNSLNTLSTLASGSVDSEQLPVFDESLIFSSPEGRALKEEFRKRVRNVNALMSCVGCDRCRLWGKLQTAGYGTALKLLFELPEKPCDDLERCQKVLANFRRSELVALINTFDRLSKSVEAVEYFRNQLASEAEQAQNQTKNSLTDAWDPELVAAWEGIKFILQSYIDFPKNVWHLILYYSSIWWDKIIAKPDGRLYHKTHVEL